eukprot:358377_1
MQVMATVQIVIPLTLIAHVTGRVNDIHFECMSYSTNSSESSPVITTTLDEEYNVLFDPSTGQRSRFWYNHMLQIIQSSAHDSNAPQPDPNSHTTAYNDFAFCLELNRDQLKVKDLKDIYRIRGIPNHCCSSLAAAVLPPELMQMFPEDQG